MYLETEELTLVEVTQSFHDFMKFVKGLDWST